VETRILMYLHEREKREGRDLAASRRWKGWVVTTSASPLLSSA
jgi:hypothetical protein